MATQEPKVPPTPGRRLQIAVEDVGAIAAVFPDRAAWERCSYEKGWLIIPDDLYPLVQGIDLEEARRQRLRDRAQTRRRALLDKPIQVAGYATWVDRGTRADIDQLMRDLEAGVVPEPAQFKWADGAFARVTAGALAQVAAGISNYVSQAFAAEAAVMAAIDAGSITTPAEVEAGPWPAG